MFQQGPQEKRTRVIVKEKQRGWRGWERQKNCKREESSGSSTATVFNMVFSNYRYDCRCYLRLLQIVDCQRRIVTHAMVSRGATIAGLCSGCCDFQSSSAERRSYFGGEKAGRRRKKRKLHESSLLACLSAI